MEEYVDVILMGYAEHEKHMMSALQTVHVIMMVFVKIILQEQMKI